MTEFDSVSSESDLDDLDWTLKNKKKTTKDCHKIKNLNLTKNQSITSQSLSEKYQKFNSLVKKSGDIRIISNQILLRSEKNRARKLVKKVLKDPFIKEEVEKNKSANICGQTSEEKEKEEWNKVKPFLTVNKHLQGPVSHGHYGPKSELETTIEEAIKEGDFQKAELLSDTLSNKQFAQKICSAFSAKRCQEELEEQRAIDKAQQTKKIRWTFEAKEKWQMKGNM